MHSISDDHTTLISIPMAIGSCSRIRTNAPITAHNVQSAQSHTLIHTHPNTFTYTNIYILCWAAHSVNKSVFTHNKHHNNSYAQTHITTATASYTHPFHITRVILYPPIQSFQVCLCLHWKTANHLCPVVVPLHRWWASGEVYSQVRSPRAASGGNPTHFQDQSTSPERLAHCTHDLVSQGEGIAGKGCAAGGAGDH